MKKSILLKAILILLPVLAVGLATTVNSVTVFNTLTGQTEYYSYFDMLPVENLKLVTPLTALLAALSGILAVAYIANKRLSFLKAAGYVALASSCAAAIPMMVREEILVIPNVGLPIFMVLEFFAAYMLEKNEKAKEKKILKVKRKNK